MLEFIKDNPTLWSVDYRRNGITRFEDLRTPSLTDFTCIPIVNSLLCPYRWWIWLHRWWIQFSVWRNRQYVFTDGKLPYNRYQCYRRTVFLDDHLSHWRCRMTDSATDFTCLLIVSSLLHPCQWWTYLHRWWIQFFIGTDWQYLFTNGELPYHRYRWYRRSVFLDDHLSVW